MNPDPTKLRQQQRQTEQAGEFKVQEKSQGPHEFPSVEEMIRFDAAQHSTPESVEERLKESVSREPPAKSWWQRLFGG